MAKFIFSGDVIIAVGFFVLGWLVFKRPDIMDRLIAWLRSKIGL